MRLCWKKKKSVETTNRVIRANDAEFNAEFEYANNFISTSKYNVITFLPKNLFEQFRRLANAYFLFLLILQLIPYVSSLSPLTTVIPLCVVLAVSAIKDAVDDFQRHRSDRQVNNRRSWVLRDGQLVEDRWHTVVVGDIIRMENDQFVAADLLLLSSSEPNSLCYIETAELDGETNLKVRQALPETAEMEDSLERLTQFNGEVMCEPPNNVLSKFEGKLTWKDQSFSLDNDKVLLRGCVLRNTHWCYGMVIFAGRDTKLMMNSGKAKFKQTHIDRLMNVLIIGIFIFLVSLCLVCTICAGIWETFVGFQFQLYLPWEDFVPGTAVNPAGADSGQKSAGATVIAILVFFSYIIVLNTVVPISLYVSVEMIRFGHSWFINWDSKMYHAKSNTPARSRTTTLNEELGQIEYIFSDKTGTLTQNVMTFNKCSINRISYGDVYDLQGNPIDITEKTPRVDFSSNPYYEPTFEFYDKRLLEAVRLGNPQVHMFFRLLALCHTVMPAEKDGVLEYQAQSPDEAALVSATRNFGFVFKSRTPNSITIEVLGVEETYELLCILDFNNVRKRMSVILRKDNQIVLMCKGADSTIYERLDPSCAALQAVTTAHLEIFAQDGLRTLCLAMKEIDPAYFEQWKLRHHEASTSLEDREDKVSAVYEEIEEGMMLIGATAIEDKLQDGVPECIANLANADIKIWVLTGDKQETAVNIGYSCKLLTEEMEQIFVIDGDTMETVREQLTSARNEMMKKNSAGGTSNPGYTDTVSNSGSRYGTMTNGNAMPQDIEAGSFALILNGHSLVHGLKPDMELLLLETGSLCKAVICCRVTPLQKALVVNLVKKHKKSITLAIGDGANDVSMIKMAHIGIGISGQEGLQAVLASDYSLAQFRFLERLLLVHGRWSYLRMCKFLKYFFYKNFAFTLCHFWFAFFCGFSAQTLYDPFFITLYNVIYTSLPVMALGFFDQDVNEEASLRFPHLYAPGHLDLLFNKKVFAQSVTEGIITSLVLFFVPYGAFQEAVQPSGIDISGYRAFGCMVASALIITVTLRCGLDTYYWTGFNHFVIWGSIIFYFIFTFIFYCDTCLYDYMYSGTATTLMQTANFWFTLLLTVVIILIPVVAERFYYVDTRPTLTDKVRLQQKIGKIRKLAGVRVLRRRSTLRQSQRSVGRSGYAFSHQEGFGELITSGSIMRRKHPFKEKGGESLSKGLATHLSTLSIASPIVLESPGFPSPSVSPAVVSVSLTALKQPTTSASSVQSATESELQDISAGGESSDSAAVRRRKSVEV